MFPVRRLTLGRAARRNNIYWSSESSSAIVAPSICSVLFFAPDGSLLGKHRKGHAHGSERLVWGLATVPPCRYLKRLSEGLAR